MFETYPIAQLPEPPGFQSETTRWAYVAQSRNDEWFYVTHEYLQAGDPEHPCRQQFLIPEVPYLMGLIHSGTPEARIVSIQLVSPPWLNGQGDWQMEQLVQLCVVPSSMVNRYIYVVEGREAYLNGCTSEDLNTAQILWSRGDGERDT
ncbi:hypothetical protein JQX08_10120 [Pseudomonas sp. UL073]|uniref:Uncharacterized protein n=1 Tax=Zestomonas insulae TaxID=2809017 RepID=A0ABS2IDB7_9GAMM|nr:hypothetical protein [Pseudomonas insulae]MBM7061062.1 hypothetical protein [Pseudomonas insulae]